jgi:hypothetical protein
MGGKKILAPFNFSDYDERALHYIIRNYAGKKWVEIVLFHVYIPLPALEGYSNRRLGHLKRTMASMWREVREKEKDLRQVKWDLIDNGFLEKQVHYVFKEREKNIGIEIVREAQTGNYDTIVIAQKPRRATRSFTRKIHDILFSELANREIVFIT